MTDDARDLIDVLGYWAQPVKQEDIAFALWGLDGTTRRVQAALQEARLAGWPLCSGGDGVWLSTDADEVAAGALALRRRAIHQLETSRALRQTAARMRKPTLWDRPGVAA